MSNTKKTGIIRKFDNLGRVVVPKEFRKVLNMNENDSVEMTIVGNTVVLKKPVNSCMNCGHPTSERAKEIDMNLCDGCIDRIKNIK